jgi:hypothetical protein
MVPQVRVPRHWAIEHEGTGARHDEQALVITQRLVHGSAAAWTHDSKSRHGARQLSSPHILAAQREYASTFVQFERLVAVRLSTMHTPASTAAAGVPLPCGSFLSPLQAVHKMTHSASEVVLGVRTHTIVTP